MGTTPREIGTWLTHAALSLFCADAALLASRSVEAVAERCRPGDTIAIPATQAAAIGRLCDLTRATPTAGGVVICQMTQPRGVR